MSLKYPFLVLYPKVDLVNAVSDYYDSLIRQCILHSDRKIIMDLFAMTASFQVISPSLFPSLSTERLSLMWAKCHSKQAMVANGCRRSIIKEWRIIHWIITDDYHYANELPDRLWGAWDGELESSLSRLTLLSLFLSGGWGSRRGGGGGWLEVLGDSESDFIYRQNKQPCYSHFIQSDNTMAHTLMVLMFLTRLFDNQVNFLYSFRTLVFMIWLFLPLTLKYESQKGLLRKIIKHVLLRHTIQIYK